MDGEPKSVGKCILFRFLLKVGRGDGWVGAKRNRERRNGSEFSFPPSFYEFDASGIRDFKSQISEVILL